MVVNSKFLHRCIDVANFCFTLSGETSPRTADMGIGLYAALALTSLTGMAWVGKRRGSGRES